MQVNRVQSPSFGALKIKPDAIKDIQNASPEVIKMIDTVGEEIKTIADPVLEIRKGLRPRLVWKDGTVITGRITFKKPNIWSNNTFLFMATQESDKVKGLLAKPQRQMFKYMFPTYPHVRKAYARLLKMTNIERAGELAKISEDIFDGSVRAEVAKPTTSSRKLLKKYKD